MILIGKPISSHHISGIFGRDCGFIFFKVAVVTTISASSRKMCKTLITLQRLYFKSSELYNWLEYKYEKRIQI